MEQSFNDKRTYLFVQFYYKDKSAYRGLIQV